MNAPFKKLCIGLALALLSVGSSWAGTSTQVIGKPLLFTQQMRSELDAKLLLKADEQCHQNILEARTVNALRIALSLWSGCTGTKMNLQHLKFLEAADLPGIQNSTASPVILKTQLCSLAHPLVVCPLDEAGTSAVLLLKPNPSPPPQSSVPVCELETSHSPNQTLVAGVQSISFPLRASKQPDCTLPNVQLVFSAGKDHPAACTTQSGPTKTQGAIVFTFTMQPSLLAFNDGGCNLTVVRDGVSTGVGGFLAP